MDVHPVFKWQTEKVLSAIERRAQVR